MSKFTFDQLIPIYRNTIFNATYNGGRIRVSDASILETLTLINGSDMAVWETGIRLMDEPEKLAMDEEVLLEITPPRTGLGFLANDMEALLSARSNRIQIPRRYYLIDERFAYNDPSPPEKVRRYHAAIAIVRAISEAAAFVDKVQAEATFLGRGRFRVPLRYSSYDLDIIDLSAVEELQTFVDENIHRDQKLAILSTAIIEICEATPINERFPVIMRACKRLVSKAQEGYKLFASEFSYEKIRSKTEDAIGEYGSKIHKTFHDIQNQVMGIPVATVIVATQFKKAGECGLEFWANLAISIGATLFVMLLSAAVFNQLMTLDSIQDDLGRQTEKLKADYASVADSFVPMYKKLGKRLITHRVILGAIVGASWLGVYFTWYIFDLLTKPSIFSCVA